MGVTSKIAPASGPTAAQDRNMTTVCHQHAVSIADDPFQLPGRWYRGNLHTHTTNSDGALSPAQVAAWYCGHGYHFVALTDHERVTDVSTAVCAAGTDTGGTHFVVVPGAETSVGPSRQGSPVHVVAIGVLDGLPAPTTRPHRFPAPWLGAI